MGNRRARDRYFQSKVSDGKRAIRADLALGYITESQFDLLCLIKDDDKTAEIIRKKLVGKDAVYFSFTIVLKIHLERPIPPHSYTHRQLLELCYEANIVAYNQYKILNFAFNIGLEPRIQFYTNYWAWVIYFEHVMPL